MHKWAKEPYSRFYPITVSYNYKFQFKATFLDNTNNGIIDADTAVPSQYLNDIWITVEIHLINCEINFNLNWSWKCRTEFYVAVVTLPAQNNTKILQQLKPGFKHVINWNKYQSKRTTDGRNQY